MNWNEIEGKWATIAQRIGRTPSLATGKPGREEDPPEIPPGDLPGPTPPLPSVLVE